MTNFSSIRRREALQRAKRLAQVACLALGTVTSTTAQATDPAPASSPPARAALASDPSVVAATPHPHAYGILVGTNVGGEGQKPLRYAEEDAERVAQVLRELGRYGSTDMRVLTQPDPAKVFAALDEVAAKMRKHRQKGEEAILFFYYSGHAKANAFSLGASELPIAALRDRIRQIPSTVTFVVLDACQSGQYARTKGAEPAADFSYNSVSRITTKGTAVIASSSAQELSQESDALKSSYFTHHLVVGMRGAADADHDGKVSLDEAYRYAYRRTLASTAQTQVGSQHVTLETDLAGQGDLALTYPVDAKSQLELPPSLEGRVMVQHKTSGSIVAEVQKVKGAPLRLALIAGRYDAFVRDTAAPKPLRCDVALVDDHVSPLELARCEKVSVASVPKGEFDESYVDADVSAGGSPLERRDEVEPWNVEVTTGFMRGRNDDYSRRLAEFGYERGGDWTGRLGLAVLHGIVPNVSLGVMGGNLGSETYKRSISSSNDSFTMNQYGFSLVGRAHKAVFGREGPRATSFQIYGQIAGGLTLGNTKLTTTQSADGAPAESSDTHWGGMVGGAGGIAGVFPYWGIFLQAGYDYAPTVANLLGETHDAGGFHMELGARVRFGR